MWISNYMKLMQIRGWFVDLLSNNINTSIFITWTNFFPLNSRVADLINEFLHENGKDTTSMLILAFWYLLLLFCYRQNVLFALSNLLPVPAIFWQYRQNFYFQSINQYKVIRNPHKLVIVENISQQCCSFLCM